MWKIVHIFDGDYGCEENMAAGGELMVSVTVRNENGEEMTESVPDAWLRKNKLDIGSEWPDYSDFAIETKDLILKKASFDDWKDMFKNIWSREESARYMLWEVTKSEEEAIQRIKRTVEYQKKVKYAFFIYEKATNKAIGFAGMKEIEPGVYEDCGVGFGPEYVGKGYGTQVLNALVSEAKACKAAKFIASCRTQNTASHNLQMKCGFIFSHNEDRIDPRNNQPYVLEFNEKVL